MISPTIGRIVWVYRAEGSFDVKQPEAGIVIYVHDDHTINVEGWAATGHPFVILGCRLLQDDEPKPEGMDFAAWIPYQKGQAAKTEALQAAAAPAPDYGKFELKAEPPVEPPTPLTPTEATAGIIATAP